MSKNRTQFHCNSEVPNILHDKDMRDDMKHVSFSNGGS